MKIDLTQIVIALIGILSTIITTYLIPYFKSKTTADQRANIKGWAEAAVQCAEIIYNGAGKGDEKRAYVEKYINDMCNKANIKIDENSVRIALEDAWKNLGLDKKEDVVTSVANNPVVLESK